MNEKEDKKIKRVIITSVIAVTVVHLACKIIETAIWIRNDNKVTKKILEEFWKSK